MKKILVIAVVLILVISLAACGGGSEGGTGGDSGSGTTSGGEDTAGVDEHNCPCDPECTNKECEGGAKCKCGTDEEYPPLTYNIEIEAELTCDEECGLDGCGMDTFGMARVTMDYIDSNTGYFGKGEGSGATTRNGMHELAVKFAVVPGSLPDFEFTAQLSVPSDNKTFFGVDEDYQTMLLSVDRIGPDETTYDFSAWGGGIEPAPGLLNFTYWGETFPSDVGTAYNDLDTGLMVFELPLTNEPITVLFMWGDYVSINVTLTPVD